MALIEEFKKQGNYLFRYRSIFPVPILVIGILVYILPRINGYESYCPEWLRILYFIVGLAGLAVRSLVVGFTPRGTSGRNREQQIADSLNTAGMYNMVRHPLYVGNFLMWLACALLTENLWFIVSFILFFWVYYERIMFAEENFLREKFGNVYLEWSLKVPAFVPSHIGWVRPDADFSMKNVIKREYYGVFSLISIFAMFDLLDQVFGPAEINWFSAWFIAFYISLVVTLLIRFLKKSTRLLSVEGR
jgi:protein-S-isoprenylcysteine O-methyltransferase Ste14